MGWRFHAYRLKGDGTETPVAFELPLMGVRMCDDLSGPGELSCEIKPELLRLKDAGGEPILIPWNTAIYAELDGQIRGGYILEDRGVDAETLTLKIPGFRGYLSGMPYDGDYSKVQVDPLDVARHIWAHVQGKGRGDLGLEVDSTKSPIRIGEPEKQVEFTTGGGDNVEFETGPYKLNWWSTDDLGKEFDDLASETPFDYRISHKWDGETVSHHLHLGYPTLGRRRTDLRFKVGENILERPELTDTGAEYANEVIVLGAGEGRDMIRGSAKTTSGRLRRVRVVTDKTIRSKKRANSAAAAELKAAIGDWDFQEFIMRDHPNAPIGALNVGDEVLIQIPAGWNEGLDLWVKVLSIEWEPEKDQATIVVRRSDRV